MQKSFIAFAIGALALGFGAGPANAGPKFVAKDSTLSFCKTAAETNGSPVAGAIMLSNLSCNTAGPANPAVPIDGMVWAEIMKVPVHISTSQSLLVTVSLTSGLYTQTSDTSFASAEAIAKVLVRVVMDPGAHGIVAEPAIDCSSTVFGCVNAGGSGGTPFTWGIAFDERIQFLGSDFTIVPGDVDNLALTTADGHSFQFAFPAAGVTMGNHTLAVEVAVVATASATPGIGSANAIAAAAFGIGLVTAESVTFAQGGNALNF